MTLPGDRDEDLRVALASLVVDAQAEIGTARCIRATVHVATSAAVVAKIPRGLFLDFVGEMYDRAVEGTRVYERERSDES